MHEREEPADPCWQQVRELRQHIRPAETLLWPRLRRKQLDGWKFRRWYCIAYISQQTLCLSCFFGGGSEPSQ